MIKSDYFYISDLVLLVNDGFAGVQTFLWNLCYGEDELIEAEWIKSTVSSGRQPTAGGE